MPEMWLLLALLTRANKRFVEYGQNNNEACTIVKKHCWLSINGHNQDENKCFLHDPALSSKQNIGKLRRGV